MVKHCTGTFLLSILAVVLVLFGIRHTSATTGDQVYALANVLCCIVVFGAGLAQGISAAFAKRTVLRNYSFAVAILALVVGATPLAVTSYRINATRIYLSRVYADLTRQGPPFPMRPATRPDGNPRILISHGYGVAEDRQAFEVYYHHGSDSFTLQYPHGEWEWRGNKYQGPNSQQE